jgi:hypothetical protein
MNHPCSALLLIVCLSGPSFMGCQQPAQPAGPTVTRVSAPTADQYEHLWITISDVLRDHYFRLDREDRHEGVITTWPDTTANGFEFWRPQPKNAYYWWETNLNTIQREVTVKLTPAEQNGDYDLDVEVERYRFRLEERQITNSAAAMRLFSAAAPTFTGQMERPAESAYWISLGRDPIMEQGLIDKVVKRFSERAAESPATQPAESGMK